MDEPHFAGRRLVDLIESYQDRGNRDELAERLREQWSPPCLVLLLDEPQPAIVAAAAVALGLIGRGSDAPRLARLLHHAEDAVVRAAEDALWCLWFREGGSIGCAVLTRIAGSIEEQDTENVIPLLTDLIRTQPGYAEAHHQRCQAYYLEGDYQQSMRDARRAVSLNPLHFGALATQAHCCVALDRFPEAMRLYDDVLRIHPNMTGIRRNVRALRDRLALAGV